MQEEEQCVFVCTVTWMPGELAQTLSCPAVIPQMAASDTGHVPLWSGVFKLSI